MTAVVMMAGFIVIPNISAYVQANLGLPREDLKWLYLVGGLVSLFTMQLVGYLVDRFGSFRVGTLGSVLLIGVLYIFFYAYVGLPLMLLFVFFMTAMSFRNIAYNALTTKVPAPYERARFQSIQSAVQHLASAFGAFLSAQLLHETALTNGSGAPVIGRDGRPVMILDGMPRVALVAMVLSALVPPLLYVVERDVRAKAATLSGVGSRGPRSG
jgi:predicted MFS family arabinose efflux permease